MFYRDKFEILKGRVVVFSSSFVVILTIFERNAFNYVYSKPSALPRCLPAQLVAC